MAVLLDNIWTVLGFFMVSLLITVLVLVIYFQILTKSNTIDDIKSLEKRNANIAWVLSIIITIFVSYSYFSGEKEQIGSWLENDWYTKYYVYLYYDKNDVKNYKLPALAYRNGGDYFIEEIYWPNGNTIYLDDEVVPKIKSEVEDTDGNFYYVVLSTEKVKD